MSAPLPLPALAARLASGASRLRRAFDGRAERERLLIGAAVLAISFMVADALWLTPAYARWRAVHQQMSAARHAQATALQEQQRLQSLSQLQAAEAERELALWRGRVREGEAALRQYAAGLVGPERMVPLLERLLAGHGRVRVRGLQSLPKTDLLAAEAAASAPAADARPLPALYRHGVEITLEGSYADLVAYLKDLEAMPERLLWSALRFKVEQHPRALLTLRVHTLSLERHWLEI